MRLPFGKTRESRAPSPHKASARAEARGSLEVRGPAVPGVIGVIREDSKYLVIRRADGILKGGYWCFPGGHVEPGETSAAAVRRELAEELGIEVAPIECLGSVEVVDSNHILDVWQVHHRGGDFCLKGDEIAEMRWLTPEALRRITPILPSNAKVLEMLGH